MDVVEFPTTDLLAETKATINWVDGSIDTLNITAFGHAEDNKTLMLFYNENQSDFPLMTINTESLKSLELEPRREMEIDGGISH